MSSWAAPSLVEYFFLSFFRRFLLDLVLEEEALVLIDIGLVLWLLLAVDVAAEN